MVTPSTERMQLTSANAHHSFMFTFFLYLFLRYEKFTKITPYHEDNNETLRYYFTFNSRCASSHLNVLPFHINSSIYRYSFFLNAPFLSSIYLVISFLSVNVLFLYTLFQCYFHLLSTGALATTCRLNLCVTLSFSQDKIKAACLYRTNTAVRVLAPCVCMETTHTHMHIRLTSVYNSKTKLLVVF